MTKKAFIFDLDGVIVDTAKYHFLAWKNLANHLGIDFTEEDNEQLKGVSRVESLHKILEWGNKSITDEEFRKFMHTKNEEYLSFIDAMDQSELLPNVVATLKFLKHKNVPIALGSASKNARRILKQTNIEYFFDVIVDGNDVTKAKPDPEVFLNAAEQLRVHPEDCIVFEDSVAGIKAANCVNMISVGIGSQSILKHADFVFKDFTLLSHSFLEELIDGKVEKKL